jgi:hypothetical protein
MFASESDKPMDGKDTIWSLLLNTSGNQLLARRNKVML